MTKQYYECHITMLGDPVVIRPFVEELKWKFSCIDGDPSLGDGLKCYATYFFNAKLTEQAVINKLQAVGMALRTVGINVIRLKTERVVYDTRRDTVGTCSGGCVECHLDDMKGCVSA